MKLNSFLQLVEIQTKVASIFPFIIGNLFALYRYNSYSIKNMVVMLVSMLCIDMATTATNNFMDYKNAIKKDGYNFEEHNAIVQHNLNESTVVKTILTLLIIGSGFGLYLVYLTDWVILLIGMVSFAIGVLYSFGPLPISRTPFGEIFSGVFMGFVIVFLSVYIHIIPKELIIVLVNSSMLMINLNWIEIIVILIVSIPMVLGISNIMLANNICDMEDDIVNKRFTLPIYIGKKKALFVFEYSYWFVGLIYIIITILGILPWYMILMLVIFIPIKKLVNQFRLEQKKEVTFVIAVKSFVLISISMVIPLVIAVIMKN